MSPDAILRNILQAVETKQAATLAALQLVLKAEQDYTTTLRQLLEKCCLLPSSLRLPGPDASPESPSPEPGGQP